MSGNRAKKNRWVSAISILFMMIFSVAGKSSHALTIPNISTPVMSAIASNSNTYSLESMYSNGITRDWGHGGWSEGSGLYYSSIFSIPAALDTNSDGAVSYRLTLSVVDWVNFFSTNMSNPTLLSDEYNLTWAVDIANADYIGDRTIWSYWSYNVGGIFNGVTTLSANIDFKTDKIYEITGWIGMSPPLPDMTVLDPNQDASFIAVKYITSSLQLSSVEPVPEPSTILLYLAGIFCLYKLRKGAPRQMLRSTPPGIDRT